MAKFDVLKAASKGYEFVWRNRIYLARVAFPVLFFQIFCLLMVFSLGLQENYLRQGLVMLPAMLVEAIFLMGLVRFYVYREPIHVWGKKIEVPDIHHEFDRSPMQYVGTLTPNNAIQVGVALYLLLKLGRFLLDSFVMNIVQEIDAKKVAGEQIPVPVASDFLVSIALLIFIVWLFRIFWMYIPMVIGFSLDFYLRKLKGFLSSICLFVAYLICSVPLSMLFFGFAEIMADSLKQFPAVNILLQSVLQGIGYLVMISVQTIALTYGIMDMLESKNTDR